MDGELVKRILLVKSLEKQPCVRFSVLRTFFITWITAGSKSTTIVAGSGFIPIWWQRSMTACIRISRHILHTSENCTNDGCTNWDSYNIKLWESTGSHREIPVHKPYVRGWRKLQRLLKTKFYDMITSVWSIVKELEGLGFYTISGNPFSSKL